MIDSRVFSAFSGFLLRLMRVYYLWNNYILSVFILLSHPFNRTFQKVLTSIRYSFSVPYLTMFYLDPYLPIPAVFSHVITVPCPSMGQTGLVSSGLIGAKWLKWFRMSKISTLKVKTLTSAKRLGQRTRVQFGKKSKPYVFWINSIQRVSRSKFSHVYKNFLGTLRMFEMSSRVAFKI